MSHWQNLLVARNSSVGLATTRCYTRKHRRISRQCREYLACILFERQLLEEPLLLKVRLCYWQRAAVPRHSSRVPPALSSIRMAMECKHSHSVATGFLRSTESRQVAPCWPSCTREERDEAVHATTRTEGVPQPIATTSPTFSKHNSHKRVDVIPRISLHFPRRTHSRSRNPTSMSSRRARPRRQQETTRSLQAIRSDRLQRNRRRHQRLRATFPIAYATTVTCASRDVTPLATTASSSAFCHSPPQSRSPSRFPAELDHMAAFTSSRACDFFSIPISLDAVTHAPCRQLPLAVASPTTTTAATAPFAPAENHEDGVGAYDSNDDMMSDASDSTAAFTTSEVGAFA